MMEYLHLFSDSGSHDAVYNGGSYNEPWVAYIEDDELVTYNKPSWTFDEAILDLSLYDHENLVVEDIGEGGHWMWLSNSAQTVQSIMSDGINYNAAVFVSGEHEMPIPSDASFKLITDHEVSLPGREFTYDDVTVQTRGKESYTYFYDLSSDTATRVHCVTGGTSYFKIQYNLVQAPLVEREFSSKRLYEKLDVDLVQHLPQLTDMGYNANYLDAHSIFNKFWLTIENDAFVFQDHSSFGPSHLLTPITAVICGVKYSDFFTVNSMSGDSSNVFTMDITRKPFWTDKCYLGWSDNDLPECYNGYSEDMSFEIPSNEDFCVRLVLDGSEVARSSITKFDYYSGSKFSNDDEGFHIYFDAR